MTTVWLRTRAARGLALAVVLLLCAGARGLGQAPALSIVSSTPDGPLDRLADADQVRIVFSEPMVGVDARAVGQPAWLRMVPAAPGTFYWSGTRTLVFSPAPQLPFATRFTVRVDSSAESTSGRRLTSPHEFTFTTPAVRLLGAAWHRKSKRYDSPVVLILRFNQPVSADDAASHVRVAFKPHEWKATEISSRARAWLSASDPMGLRRFDEKVDAVRRVASSSDRVAVRRADSWNTERYPPSPSQAVLETESSPPPDAWLSIDATGMPSPAGPLAGTGSPVVVELEPAFFGGTPNCEASCDPDAIESWMQFSRPVEIDRATKALTVVDVTPASGERPVPQRTALSQPPFSRSQTWSFSHLGFDQPPPGSTWRFRLAPDLAAEDGQVLGYPAVSFRENANRRAIAVFSGSVWEAGLGTRLPVTVRNTGAITSWLAGVDPSTLVPMLLRYLGREPPASSGSGQSSEVRLKPNELGRFDLDVSSVVSARAGLLTAAIEPADLLPGSYAGPRSFRDILDPGLWLRPRHMLAQVTNLGITVKHSARSTLVFVTRLDSGEPVPGAAVTICGRVERDALAWDDRRWRCRRQPGPDARADQAVDALLLRRDREHWR